MPAAITPFDLMVRSLALIGCGTSPADYRRGDRPPTGWLARLDRARTKILDRLVDGTITPLIDNVFPLEHAAHAHRRVENREATGKVILHP